MSNRLLHETSPYLLEHAHNPVDWHPYGKSAFSKAQAENKPIFLSIGYSACHWCHVMAHESFEDLQTAQIMNQHFINIKMDREEYPEIDHFYQQAFQRMSQRGGGWPLSFFLTPYGKPFYGGTYFPKEERFGLPSFKQVLEAVALEYQNHADVLTSYADEVVESLAKRFDQKLSEDGAELRNELLNSAARTVFQTMDLKYGGMLGSPKFPNVPVLSFLLRASFYEKDPRYAQAVLLTLEKMARGGIYDHLGGGFSRYATDALWHVPHFEKMLDDNALLIRLYSEAYQIALSFNKAELVTLFSQKVHHTVDWLHREMCHPKGIFYASQDADSEGIEGKYYVWTQKEIAALCTPEEAEVLCRCYGVLPEGNWKQAEESGLFGANVLHEVNFSKNEKEASLLESAKRKLFVARRKRIHPQTDRKILASWNGLLLSGLSIAARIFRNDDYLALAKSLGQFFLEKKTTQLLRNYQEGAAPLPATLDDYAFLAEGFFYLASASHQLEYLEKSYLLIEQVVRKFYDQNQHQFMMSDPQEQQLPFEMPLVQEHDSALPSGTSVVCHQLLRLAELLDIPQGDRYRQIARDVLGDGKEYLQNPLAFSSMCSAFYLQEAGIATVILVDPAGEVVSQKEEFLEKLSGIYLPEFFIFVSGIEASLGIFQMALGGKTAWQGKPTIYICHNQKCLPPVTDFSLLPQILLGK